MGGKLSQGRSIKYDAHKIYVLIILWVLANWNTKWCTFFVSFNGNIYLISMPLISRNINLPFNIIKTLLLQKVLYMLLL